MLSCPSTTPTTYTVRELAERLHLSAPTARRLARAIGFRAGRSLRVDADALARWLRSRGSIPSRTGKVWPAPAAQPARRP